MAKTYKQLEVYQLSFDLFIRTHRFSFKMPKYEMCELGSQIRRSADSVNSNIVEGYGRNRYKKDFIKFLVYSHSSNDETKNHLLKIKTLYPHLEAFGGVDQPSAAGKRYRLLKGKAVTEGMDTAWLKTLPAPTPVFTTAIYSKKDKVISWKHCIDKQEDALHKNIEAYCTRMGMPYDKTALKVVAERLASVVGASKNI